MIINDNLSDVALWFSLSFNFVISLLLKLSHTVNYVQCLPIQLDMLNILLYVELGTTMNPAIAIRRREVQVSSCGFHGSCGGLC